MEDRHAMSAKQTAELVERLKREAACITFPWGLPTSTDLAEHEGHPMRVAERAHANQTKPWESIAEANKALTDAHHAQTAHDKFCSTQHRNTNTKDGAEGVGE
jgi:hypothetical protein